MLAVARIKRSCPQKPGEQETRGGTARDSAGHDDSTVALKRERGGKAGGQLEPSMDNAPLTEGSVRAAVAREPPQREELAVPARRGRCRPAEPFVAGQYDAAVGLDREGGGEREHAAVRQFRDAAAAEVRIERAARARFDVAACAAPLELQ